MSRLLSLYHRLPPPARNLAATLRGYYLRSWRYGPETERLVEEALERERWSAEQWQRWQEERLAYVLHRAATQVPYYRQQWSERRRKGDAASWGYLENWPILDKEPLRAHPQAFVADDCDISKMYHDHTSGTTGTPLHLYFSRSTLRQWYALFEARLRRWHGVSIAEPWGIFGGQAVVPFSQRRPPFWVRNRGLNQVYFSTSHIAPWSARHYVDAIQRFGLTHLIVYASSMYSLTLDVPSEELPVRSKLRVILSNAEPLHDFQRTRIERVLGCQVRETYGLAEMVCAASECEAGRLHWWPEVGIVEVLDGDDGEAGQHNRGKLVATGLFNVDMPLIRYDTNDMAEQTSEAEITCPCSRSLPLLGKVLGRHDDVLVTEDGRRPALVDIIFDPALHIREAQIVQEDLHNFTIKVVPAEGWSRQEADRLARALRQKVGDVNVQVTEVQDIERTWAGKFRIIISNLTDHKEEVP